MFWKSQGEAGQLELEVEEGGGAVEVGEDGEEEDGHDDGPAEVGGPAEAGEDGGGGGGVLGIGGGGVVARFGVLGGGLLAEDLLGVGEEPDDGEEGEGERSIEDGAGAAEAVVAGHVVEEREGGVERI